MPYTLITGASSGIGEEFARQYAAKGHSLILVARSKDKLDLIANELKKNNQINIQVIQLDLGKIDSAEELFKKCQELKLEVNFLINNAGIGVIGKFESHSLDEIQSVLRLNILTLTKLTYLFLPQLKKNNGSLINLASQVSFNPAPYMTVYAATKAYVLSFTEALRTELAGTQMKIMALCPGPTYTNFFERAKSSPNDINFKFRTTEEVVSAAISGIESGNDITVPGWENKTFTFLTRFMSKNMLAKFAQYTVKKS